MIDDDLEIRAEAEGALALCRARGLMVTTAESCTGGLVAAALTAVAGSSDVVDRGFVTYSNEAKRQMLGVPEAMLVRHGAVSKPVAEAMAKGALARSRAGVSVAVTGIAGPGGGSAEKPVGLVWFAVSRKSGTVAREMRFGALGRAAVRRESVLVALGLIRWMAETSRDP